MDDGRGRLVELPHGRLHIPGHLLELSRDEPVFLVEETPDGVILTFANEELRTYEDQSVIEASSRVWLSRDGFDRLVTHLAMVRSALEDQDL